MKHSRAVFTPRGFFWWTRQKEIAAFEDGVAYGSKHWKANHDKVVKQLRKALRKLHEYANVGPVEG